MKIVFNDLIKEKMAELNITRRQATFAITGPNKRKENDGIFEVQKYIDKKSILIRYTIQCAEIKIAAVELLDN